MNPQLTYPVEVLNFIRASLCNCINCVHCDDHSFIFVSFPQFIYDLFHKSLTNSFIVRCHATSNREEKCDVTLPWLQNFWITTVGSLSNENGKKAIGMISETTICTCITLFGAFLFVYLLFFHRACLHGGGGPHNR